MNKEETRLREKLGGYVQDALAMENNVLLMLTTMVQTTDDPKMRELVERHHAETEVHVRRLQERLDESDSGSSLLKNAVGIGGALGKGMLDMVRGDKPGQNARDAFATEHFEIAAYELLERVAERAGDSATAEVARLNRADEVKMAKAIAASWDRVVELTLAADKRSD